MDNQVANVFKNKERANPNEIYYFVKNVLLV